MFGYIIIRLYIFIFIFILYFVLFYWDRGLLVFKLSDSTINKNLLAYTLTLLLLLHEEDVINKEVPCILGPYYFLLLFSVLNLFISVCILDNTSLQ